MSVHKTIAELRQTVEELRTTVANLLRPGAVAQVDAEKGYRLKLGQDGEGGDWLSPWLPHPDTGKTSVPLKVGQVVGLISPNGDMRQGFLLRGGYGGNHKSPNGNMDANVFEDAGVRFEVADGALVITAGGTTIKVSGEGLSITGGRVEHDGQNIGSSHVHPGIRRGDSRTDPPE
ncbi:phage baseplate assembly protein V [Aureimonas sp. AU40]|uniref:phage baseplate assembly protein V n=1 Tax=Aureimonas sp. AU40 TaxID=1637747 RepID=UPI000785B402|nr:phage baseplate assembly protein V [Aureimonas sp. AU40]